MTGSIMKLVPGIAVGAPGKAVPAGKVLGTRAAMNLWRLAIGTMESSSLGAKIAAYGWLSREKQPKSANVDSI